MHDGETAATYLKAAGIPVRPPGGWGRAHPKPAIEVSTDPGHENGPADEAGRWPQLRRRAPANRSKSSSKLSQWPERDGHLAGPGRQPPFQIARLVRSASSGG